MSRVGSGQGLPWPKSMALKSIVSQERSRVALLRLLELRLGIRHQTNLLLSANGEIIPVVSTSYCILLFVTNCSLIIDITMHLLSYSQIVSRAVYKGVLDLLKYTIQPIESALHSDIDTPIFSLFLILRLALCICTNPNRKKNLPKSHSVADGESNGHRTPSPLPPNYNFSVRRSLPTPSLHPSQDLFVFESNVNDAPAEGVPSDDCKRVRTYDPSLSSDNRETEGGGGGGEEDVLQLQYLHVDLLRGFSNVMKQIVVKRQFWNGLFSAVVQADRKYLGWNEKTSELYDR